MVSVGTMIYAIFHFRLGSSWNELVLNMFYLACLVMIAMYFFKTGITTKQFNDWCTLCVGIMLTFFYARKDWKTYSKRNLWMICIVDVGM